jgi:hypothetical protein
MLQEEDVIGVLPSGDKISSLKPLGDRVLIKVRPAAMSACQAVETVLACQVVERVLAHCCGWAYKLAPVWN